MFWTLIALLIGGIGTIGGVFLRKYARETRSRGLWYLANAIFAMTMLALVTIWVWANGIQIFG